MKKSWAMLLYNFSPSWRFLGVFWDKIESLEDIGICDKPRNEIYHMYHKPQNKNNYEDMKNLQKHKMLAIIFC